MRVVMLSNKNVLMSAGLLAVVVIFLPFALVNQYHLGIVNFIIMYSILCLGLNLIVGYTGLLSLGHAAFYGIGAYTTAILMKYHGFGFLPALVVSSIAVLLSGLLLGIPTRKVRGDYFCLLTIALGEIFRLVAQSWIEVTNGAMGIVGIPIPEIFGWSIKTETDFYFLGIGLLGFTFFSLLLLIKSKYGRAFVAIREDELAASVMGVNVSAYKILAFGIG
ncbi:MAG: branched-chain amino acid ABC transporter permease, partial [Thermodesulfobacteriota bacterium]|nr:branched-chain amino acid ABC transporter permease [Thermodesulfobacteriota bacterium]